jgi:hypothetical protein
LKSDRQHSLLQASAQIDQGLKIDSQDTSVIGAWADGAENSVMTVVKNADFAKLKLAAAMKAHLADQKASLVFQEHPQGKAVLFDFDARGSLGDIHKNLLADGVAFHTLVPTQGGAKVYVVDMDGSSADAVEKGAKRYGTEANFVRGNAQFVGTTKEDGSDREQRDDARDKYLGVIKGSRVQGAGGVWDRVHSTYGESLTRKSSSKEPVKHAA